MEHCKERGCLRDVWKHAKDSRCIFHTTTGKKPVSTYERARRRLYGRGAKIESYLTEEFVQSFIELVKQSVTSKSELDCTNFVFPELEIDLWEKLWSPLITTNEQNESIISFDFLLLLQNTTFYCNVNFDKTNFKKSVDFKKATFNRSVIFNDAKFNESVMFIGTKFNGEVHFWGTEFSKITSFAGSVFKADAFFRNAQFFNTAMFNRAHFEKSVYFEGAVFKDNVTFVPCQFNGLTNFVETEFEKKISFKGSDFHNDVFFNNATIGIVGDFSLITFENKASFKGTTIVDRGDFASTKFYKEADFSDASIRLFDLTRCEIFSFLRLRNIQTPNNPVNAPIILLRDLRFWENGHLILEDLDLSNTSFWQTIANIIRPRITFIRVNWGKDKVILDDTNRKEYHDWKSKKLDNKTWTEIYKIVDEYSSKTEEIERCYKQIRLVYEANGEYPDAGDFYLSEMNARKHRLKGLLWLLHILYGWISKYGESAGLAAVWFFGLWFGFAILLAFLGFEKFNDSFQLSFKYNLTCWGNTLNIIGDAIIAVAKAIFLGRMEPYRTVSFWSSLILNVVARVFGLSILTLLLLAIRRRFRR